MLSAQQRWWLCRRAYADWGKLRVFVANSFVLSLRSWCVLSLPWQPGLISTENNWNLILNHHLWEYFWETLNTFRIQTKHLNINMTRLRFCSCLKANQAWSVREHFPQPPWTQPAQPDLDDPTWLLHQVSFLLNTQRKTSRHKLVTCSALSSHTCTLVPHINTSLMQEWSTGRHTGGPQESSKCEALRHGCHVHVVPREET